MKNNKAYQQAKKRVQFKIHVLVYLAVNLMLLVINISTASDELWVKWPVLGWGIGLFNT